MTLENEIVEEKPPPPKKSKVQPKPPKPEKKISELEIDGKKEVHVRLSPVLQSGEPPEPEELIKALTVIKCLN